MFNMQDYVQPVELCSTCEMCTRVLAVSLPCLTHYSTFWLGSNTVFDFEEFAPWNELDLPMLEVDAFNPELPPPLSLTAVVEEKEKTNQSETLSWGRGVNIFKHSR